MGNPRIPFVNPHILLVTPFGAQPGSGAQVKTCYTFGKNVDATVRFRCSRVARMQLEPKTLPQLLTERVCLPEDI